MHIIETMTELWVENAIKAYQRRQRDIRNQDLRRGMGQLRTAEQFLSALHALVGLGTEEREAAKMPKILQTLA